MTAIRRLAIALGIAVLVSMASAAVGNAANYRYWGFFQQVDGAWTAAAVGAAQAVPEHGAVDGWRYAVVGDTAVREPRTDLTFDDICPDAEAADGFKVVAVVIDPGTTDDSPDDTAEGDLPGAFAECAEVEVDATSMDVLTAVTDVVDEGGFVCSVGGYPASGCDPNEVPGEAPTDDGSTVDVALPGGPGATSSPDDATDDAATPDDADEPTETATDDAAADDVAADEAASDDEDSVTARTVVLIAAVVVVLALAVAAVIRARRNASQA